MLKRNSLITIFVGISVFILFVLVFMLANVKDINPVDNSILELNQREESSANNTDDLNENTPKLKIVNLDVSDEEISNLLSLDYSEVLNNVKDPKVFVALLNADFEINDRNSLIALEPAEFYRLRAGSDVDMAVFVAQSVKKIDQQAGVIRFDYRLPTGEEKYSFAVIWRDAESPKYMSIDNDVQIYDGAWSFKEFVKERSKMLGGEVTRYTYFPAGILNLESPQSPFEWENLDN